MSRSRKPTERRQLHSWTLDAAISLCRDQQYLLKRQEEMIGDLVVRNRQFARSGNLAKKEVAQLTKSNEVLEKKLKRARKKGLWGLISHAFQAVSNENREQEEDERLSVSSDDSIEHKKSAVKTNEKLQEQDR